MKKEWFTLNEFVKEALFGMPTSQPGYLKLARRDDWDGKGKSRTRADGNGKEYHYTALPERQQAELVIRYTPKEAEPKAKVDTAPNEQTWEWFEKQPQSRKDEGARRLRALLRVDDLRAQHGANAIKIVAKEVGASHQTIRNWLDTRKRANKSDWLPALTPSARGGGGRRVEIDPNFQDATQADYLRPANPSFTSVYRRTCRIAAEQGWVIPNEKTLRRRVETIPEAVLVMAREGRDAAKALFPAQERDRSGFHALEAVNADGHKWDVFVQWPDGKVARPLTVAFQDLYSGMFLAWRTGRTENKDEVRLCFGDLIETYGIPEKAYLDNGRAFASKWLSGGTKTRYRFKVRDEDPDGVFKLLGVDVHFVTPYAGQSKPIERGFGDFARDIAKHPAFDGAYCGNNPLAKPEDYGSKAVPLATFLAVIDREIALHNQREGRQSRVCGGKLSFQQAFDQSYGAPETVIRKASAEQRRLCMLMAEGVTVRKDDGAIYLLGNRYWCEELLEYRGQKLVVRFDPENVHQDLAVYARDKRLICVARLIEAVGFADTEAAREHANARNAYLRATRERLAAERRMTLPELAQLSPPVAPYTPPETKVVRLVTAGNTALQPVAEDESETLQFYRDMDRGLRLVTGDSD
jgi:hypothetical protein